MTRTKSIAVHDTTLKRFNRLRQRSLHTKNANEFVSRLLDHYESVLINDHGKHNNAQPILQD